MDNLQIKHMIESGFAIRRISKILNIPIQYINDVLGQNNWSILKEEFNEDKINYICELYNKGVSAKNLGIKFSIDKRRIQKWVDKTGKLRSKNDSHRFTEFNQHIFDKIDTEEKAYWLGFLYADAYNCVKTNTVSLSLQTLDLNHLIKISKFLDLPESKITFTKNKEGYEYYTVKMYSKHLSSKLDELGCHQAKSFIIKYPSWLDANLNIAFIRGMFDGDGSICKRENNEWKWSLATTKECGLVIQDIIFKQLNINIGLSYISKTNNNTYELESNGNEKVLKLMHWLYDTSTINTRLDRKYQKMLDLMEQQNNRKFSRKEYKISDEEKKIIINKIDNNENIINIAKNHSIYPRTAVKIMKDGKYLFEKIAVIDGKPITSKYVKTLDYNERMALVEPLFEYFRKQGWTYPDNPSKLNNSYKKLCQWQPDLNNNELFNNSSLATDICKYFCHKFYDATEFNKLTMKEVFEDDAKLKRLIINRLGFDWWDKEDNDETFNICFRMLIQGMRSSRLVPSISIFKPNIAKYMYMKYSNEGDIVYDYSAGWGGRLLGAASCNRKYIGVDPWTTDELQKIVEYFNFENITLINDGSENVKLDENSIDFSFSSPPYFDQEVYSKDDRQAYNKGEDYFYNTYWKNTLSNIKYMLKPNRYFGLNITNKYKKMLDITKDYFGEVVETIKLRTVRSHLNKSAGIEKYEPIYIFKNIK